ncbi:MAG: thiamine phosphate synthase [Proteobacteria bacterium]|nr:thiamine phosphate synthase [Pseudomonadota bacterium]MBU1640793.1 thiamine phosphate synthase [Pseudomonadota bacterium]
MTYSQRLQQFIEQVTVYPVSCEKLACGRTDIQWLAGVLAGGAKIVQLRDKTSDDRTLLAKAKEFRRMTAEAGALFIVNNRLDIALLSEADGLHLGNNDIPAQEARRLAPDLIIGVSANTEQQASAAQKIGASYYNIGPLFATKTKSGLHNFIGPQAIATYSAHSDLPFTVMGGIKKEHIAELTALGARRLAVVTALTAADDIAQETHLWHQEIMKGLAEKTK